MRIILIIISSILITNCSLNSDSKYWNENTSSNQSKLNKIKKIKLKSKDIISMSIEEYELYLKDYTKNSNYPDLKEWLKKLN